MFDVQKNNWILNKELPAPSYAAKAMLEIEIGLAEPPVFNTLQRSFWFEHFADQHYQHLAKQIRMLGQTAPQKREQCAQVLTQYFQKLVS